jgi:hypothetical protein|tara:strand:+ start:99 stop:323 length:225 start_codon:yes stop_codon:yes gene_type:complete
MEVTILITSRTGKRYLAVEDAELGLVFQKGMQAPTKAAVKACFNLRRDEILAGGSVEYSKGGWVQRVNETNENK